MKASYPEDEVERLAALAKMRVMDTEGDEVLDSLTQMAADIFDVPTSLVSLVDAERQWFKSRVGLDATQTSRDVAFCAHAILGDAPLVVPDATRDARFRDNPLVTSAPEIRFYAGVPLHGDGNHRIGTLCVIDTKPRTLSGGQLADLRRLAFMAEQRLITIARLHRAEQRVAVVDDVQHILAHDLRAPARQISGLLEILAQSAELGSSPVLPLAMRSADRLQRLVNGLQQYLEAPDKGRLVAQHLGEVTGQAWESFDARGERRMTTVGAMPRLPAHEGILLSVMRHLLDNAIAHSGRDDVAITVQAVQEDAFWRIVVSDNGQGIGTSDPDRLFQVYWQRVRDAVDAGAGVGLTIVRRMVTDVGGDVGAHTNDEGGLSVWFTWPALPSDWPA